MRSLDDDDNEMVDDLDEDTVSPEESLGPAFAKLVEKGKENGVISVDDLNAAISAEQGPEAIEEAMAILANQELAV